MLLSKLYNLPMFTCPGCGQPTLHFHNVIQRRMLIDRRVRCDACGYNRPSPGRRSETSSSRLALPRDSGGQKQPAKKASALAAVTLATCPTGSRSRLIHRKHTPIKRATVEFCDGVRSLVIVCHLNEANASRVSRATILHQIDALHSSNRLEQRTDPLFRRA